jgi:myo-inositol 2-dehydrogenase / D-chiro-inositol 1-dehydrogenase
LLKSHGDDIDVVVIHGSVTKRADLAVRAAQAGKHVFVSSPLAVNSEEVERIARACETASVALVVGSHVRFRPSVMAVKTALDSGKLGLPGLLRIHCWEPDEPANRGAILNRDQGEFRSRILQQLDLALWMYPQPPKEVFASTRGRHASADQWPDYLQIHLGFPNGGMALISLSRNMPVGDDYQTVSLICSTGAAYADDHLQKHLIFRGDRPQAVQRDEIVPTLVNQLKDFAEAVASKRSPMIAADGMYAAMKLTDAIWTSLIESRPVSLMEASR